MEPLSALSFACNVLDLVGKAAKCGAAVVDVYQSSEGRKQAHSVALQSASDLDNLINSLNDQRRQLDQTIPDVELENIVKRCFVASQELRSLVGDFTAKRNSWFSAIKSVAKSTRKSGRFDELQAQLSACSESLNALIIQRTK